MRWHARLSVPLLPALLAVASPASAEGVTVKGDAGDLTVEADGAPLADVIVAVGAAVGSTIDPPASLPSATITGVYQGSVSEVLRALAPAAAFVVAWRDGRVSVHFVDGGEWAPISEAKPAAAADGEEGAPAEVPGLMQPGEVGGGQPPTPARRIY
jgi:hypothetical protein